MSEEEGRLVNASEAGAPAAIVGSHVQSTHAVLPDGMLAVVMFSLAVDNERLPLMTAPGPEVDTTGLRFVASPQAVRVLAEELLLACDAADKGRNGIHRIDREEGS